MTISIMSKSKDTFNHSQKMMKIIKTDLNSEEKYELDKTLVTHKHLITVGMGRRNITFILSLR